MQMNNDNIKLNRNNFLFFNVHIHYKKLLNSESVCQLILLLIMIEMKGPFL